MSCSIALRAIGATGVSLPTACAKSTADLTDTASVPTVPIVFGGLSQRRYSLYRRDGWFFLLCSVFAKQSVCSLVPLRHLLCPGRQSKQNALSRCSPKVLKITALVLRCLFFSTISAHLGRGNKSLLIGDFEVSAFCLTSALYRTALFKTAFFNCVR